MKRKLAALLAAAALASTLAACGGGTQTPASQPGAPASQAAPLEPTEAPTTTDAVKRGGVLTTSRLGITPLNPTKYIAMQGDKIIEGLFFDSLVNINEKMEVEPFLAESWTVSEDGLTIDMKLKEGVKYFDGTEMTAETVKYCWDWYLDPDTAANFYPLISDVQSVDAVDQYNLRFNFSQPNAGFIELMSYQAGYVLSPASIDKYKQTGDETVFAREGGTGAFKLVENVDGVSITAEKNPDYHVMGEDGQPLEHHNRLVFPQRDQQAHQPARDEEGRIICRTHENKPPQIAPELAVKAVQYRIWHTKTGGSSYLSQLELQAILDRALRRADLPMAFSQGFHPMPLMSFGRALPVGMESRAEWFAITLRTPMSAAEVHTRLASALPTGMAVIRVEEVDKSRRTEQSVAETFRLRTGSIDGEGLSLAAVRDCFASFAAQESVMLTRETKKGPRTSDIRRHLLRWKELEDGSLEFSLDWSDGYLSPLLLCTSICASLGDESRLRALLRLSKTAQHFADGQVCP